MKAMTKFFLKEKLYIAMFLLILFLYMGSFATGGAKEYKHNGHKVSVSKENVIDNSKDIPSEKIEEIAKTKPLVILISGLMFLLFLLFFVLGVAVDLSWFYNSIRRKDFFSKFGEFARLKTVSWSLGDIIRVAVTFVFWSFIGMVFLSTIYVVINLFANIKDTTLLFHSLLNDFIMIAILIYFIKYRYKTKFSEIGFHFENKFDNISTGFLGYIAFVPFIIFSIMLVNWLCRIFEYAPKMQPIVNIILREEKQYILFTTSFFAAIIGPVAEELFFRGFMYNALKKKLGIFIAVFFTAALFSLLHTNIAGFLPIFILGILLAYIYEKTGNLLCSISVHMFHNIIMLILTFLFRQFIT